MRALVTGGTGFVGSHVARLLAAQGHDVRVLHRSTSKLTALEGVPFTSAISGLTDLDGLRAACEDVDWVFHVAAVADYWRADEAQMFKINVEGTQLLLQAAREAGVKRVIFTSSAAAVGLRTNGLSDESDPFNLPPKHFPYGYSKWLAEQVVTEAVDAGQDVVTVNPVVVMGPGDLNMISGTFIMQIKRFGPFVPLTSGGVAVVDVRDVARWQLQAAENGHSGERYILGAANYSYRQWFDMIAQTVGGMRPRIYAPDFLAPIAAELIDFLRRFNLPTVIDSAQARMGVRDVYFDFSKTWGELGTPQVDMWQSLHDTYSWYRANGYL